ncbi:RING-type E3 ubiquitin transferase [Malassezia equina]|uniref:RING-type E3 ubiquitin transferase n=1 Tax=Malassezia equina TaxID=1381935 RepID=A0AAF0ECJ7_9BASI|nr:RING-type E3 ubiquitin transferase [Malassezia equina]
MLVADDTNTKMEALGTEYSNMIVSQLDSQRVFYESQMVSLKANHVTKEEYHLVCKERETLKNTCSQLQENIQSLQGDLEAVNTKSSKQETQLKRALDVLTSTKKELADEKSVSDGLYKHVQQLQDDQSKLQCEVADLREQLRDVMFFVSAREKIEQSSDTLGIAGGDVMVPEKPKTNKHRSNRKR